MKVIEVKSNDLEEEVPVIVFEDGIVSWCNHIRTETEERDFGYPDPIKCDYVDDWKTVEVCTGCKSWRFLGTDEWEEA